MISLEVSPGSNVKDSQPVHQSRNPSTNTKVTLVKWLTDNSETYKQSFDTTKINELMLKLNKVTSQAEDCSQENIDSMANEFKIIFLDAAKKSGMSKEIILKKPSSRRKNHKAWFNDNCREARLEYNKVKGSRKTHEEKRAAAKKYKQILREAKTEHNKALHSKLRTLKSSNPRDYWKLINISNKQQTEIDIGLDALKDHFQQLSQQQNPTSQIPSSEIYSQHSSSDMYNEINDPITVEELLKSVKKLKNNKAGGIDLIINEFFKYCPSSILHLAASFFNLILNSGYVPNEWTLGIIKPLYKGKGQRDNADNYRGITL